MKKYIILLLTVFMANSNLLHADSAGWAVPLAFTAFTVPVIAAAASRDRQPTVVYVDADDDNEDYDEGD